MNWEKIQSDQIFVEPVTHVFATNIFDTKEYDKLYENQNNLDHHTWREFDKQYKTGFEFIDDLRHINFQKEVICLWFFKERNDRHNRDDLRLAGKNILYFPNTFLITKSKDIEVLEKNKNYIRRPVVQLDMSNRKFESICQRIKKN